MQLYQKTIDNRLDIKIKCNFNPPLSLDLYKFNFPVFFKLPNTYFYKINLNIEKYFSFYNLYGYIDVFCKKSQFLGEASFSIKTNLNQLQNKLSLFYHQIFLNLLNQSVSFNKLKSEVYDFNSITMNNFSASIWVHEALAHGLFNKECDGLKYLLNEKKIKVYDDYSLEDFISSSSKISPTDKAIEISHKNNIFSKWQSHRLRRENNNFQFQPRPSNTYLDRTNHLQLKPNNNNKRIYITKIQSGCYCNNQFQIEISQSYQKVKNKKFWLKPFLLISTPEEFVSKIAKSGNDILWSTSLCKDRSGIIPVAHASPTLIFNKIEKYHVKLL